ncbi:hypothetical protein AYL99_10118 [Fonsecaea erecta]|uniref:Uncharacterized protein n=1 Tax=Fonsecaea erecta TaxID=1367422 RepID=A0A178Z936_9EURO|nr:hypothetical protein AYL99_10118 [Fonsecaea erecta]OAP55966.1 hypothetical protein AYL99_10118 [Fonsecaea erecta]
MTGEPDTPQSPQADGAYHRPREDARGGVSQCIEGGRASPVEAFPGAPSKYDPSHGNNHVNQLSAQQERGSLEAVSSDEVQFDFAPAQQSHPHHQNVEPSLATSPGSTSSAQVHTMTRARSIGHRVYSAGVGPIHESRVSKSPTEHRSRLLHNRQTHPQTDLATTPSQPSEEDLLFLLMSRARETQKALERLEHLENENQDLRELQGQTEAELQQATKARDEYAQYSHFLDQSLVLFREKYSKLKKWALETNKDCEMLQQSSSGFQRSLAALAKDRDYLLTQLHEARSSSRSTSEQMENIQSGVREVRVMAENSGATIKQLDAFAVAQEEHLMSEKQRCRRLEAHILHLEQEKNKQNIRLHSQHQATNQTLQDISKQLGAFHNGRAAESSATARIFESLHQIQSVIDTNLLVKSDLAPLREDCTSVNSSLTKIEGSLSKKVETAIANLRHDLQQDVSNQLLRLSLEVQSGNAEVVEAKAEVARLEGKTEQTQQIIELLREAKREAQKHEAELQDANKSLRNNKEAIQTQSEELRTSLRTVTTKWQTACSELEKCKQGRNEAHAEVIDLTIRLTEAMHELNSLQAELMASEDVLIEFEQQNADQNMELRNVNVLLSTQRSDIDYEIQRRLEIEDELAMSKALELQTRRQLTLSREETTTATRLHRDMQSQIGVLKQTLTRTDDKARKLEETLKSLEETTAELEHLRKQQATLQRFKEESVSQSQEIRDKSAEIQTLEKQIKDLRNTSADLEEEVRGKDRLAEENANIHNDLKNLREQLQQKTIETALLESALAAAQVRTAQLGDLKREKSSLKEAVESLTTALEQSNEQCAQISPLQDTVAQKDHQITELQKDLAIFRGQAEELKNLRAELQEKEERQADLQQQILGLEGAVSNAQLDGDEVNHNIQQRRVADRSGNAMNSHNNELPGTRPYFNGGDVHSPLNLSPANPTTGAIYIVQETQLEVQESQLVGPDSLILSVDQGQESSGSELSPIPSDDGEANLDDLINHGPIGLNTRRHNGRETHVWPNESSSIRHRQPTSEQPPSSPYGSQSDQMLLDQVSQTESQEPDDSDSTKTDPTFAMPVNRTGMRQGPGPRRLRSEHRGPSGRSIASPDPGAESLSNRPSTPAIMRERHRPNSTAKRRSEPENDADRVSPKNPKRLKRTAANLEAKKSQPAMPKSENGEKSSSRGAATFSKSGGGRGNSVVGTNAPGPGKIQRSTKPARKGSRRDKYTTRFGAET